MAKGGLIPKKYCRMSPVEMWTMITDLMTAWEFYSPKHTADDFAIRLMQVLTAGGDVRYQAAPFRIVTHKGNIKNNLSHVRR